MNAVYWQNEANDSKLRVNRVGKIILLNTIYVQYLQYIRLTTILDICQHSVGI